MKITLFLPNSYLVCIIFMFHVTSSPSIIKNYGFTVFKHIGLLNHQLSLIQTNCLGEKLLTNTSQAILLCRKLL